MVPELMHIRKENSFLQTLQEIIPGTFRNICCQVVELKSSLATHIPFMDEGSLLKNRFNKVRNIPGFNFLYNPLSLLPCIYIKLFKAFILNLFSYRGIFNKLSPPALKNNLL